MVVDGTNPGSWITRSARRARNGWFESVQFANATTHEGHGYASFLKDSQLAEFALSCASDALNLLLWEITSFRKGNEEEED